MPVYQYMDQNGHEMSVKHSMTQSPVISCPICQSSMWRKPQAVAVNWNGLPPHRQHERSPEVQSMIDNAPANRDRYQELHKEH